MRWLLFLLFLPIAGCVGSTDECEPIPHGLEGAAFLYAHEGPIFTWSTEQAVLNHPDRSMRDLERGDWAIAIGTSELRLDASGDMVAATQVTHWQRPRASDPWVAIFDEWIAGESTVQIVYRNLEVADEIRNQIRFARWDRAPLLGAPMLWGEPAQQWTEAAVDELWPSSLPKRISHVAVALTEEDCVWQGRFSAPVAFAGVADFDLRFVDAPLPTRYTWDLAIGGQHVEGEATLKAWLPGQGKLAGQHPGMETLHLQDRWPLLDEPIRWTAFSLGQAKEALANDRGAQMWFERQPEAVLVAATYRQGVDDIQGRWELGYSAPQESTTFNVDLLGPSLLSEAGDVSVSMTDGPGAALLPVGATAIDPHLLGALFASTHGTEPEILICEFHMATCQIARHDEHRYLRAGETGGALPLAGLLVRLDGYLVQDDSWAMAPVGKPVPVPAEWV